MALEVSPVHPRHHGERGGANWRDAVVYDVGVEIGSLRAENAELRKVVVELSKLVIRNVLRESLAKR